MTDQEILSDWFNNHRPKLMTDDERRVYNDWIEFAKHYHQIKSIGLADVGGSLQPKTCKVVNDNDEKFPCDVTTCCNVGPITRENYCPNCGAKIVRHL